LKIQKTSDQEKNFLYGFSDLKMITKEKHPSLVILLMQDGLKSKMTELL